MSGHIKYSEVASSIPFDNSTNGFTSTDVQSALEEGVNKNLTYEVSSTSIITTTTNTPAIMTGMTLSPPAGTYLALFSCTINSNNAGATIAVSLYNNGVQDTATQRFISPFDGGALSATSANGQVSINKSVTVAAGTPVTIQWSTGGGTATAGSRTLTLLRIS